jgi:hypothetical protein
MKLFQGAAQFAEVPHEIRPTAGASMGNRLKEAVLLQGEAEGTPRVRHP